MLILVFIRAENSLGKGENGGYLYFLFSPCFLKGLLKPSQELFPLTKKVFENFLKKKKKMDKMVAIQTYKMIL